MNDNLDLKFIKKHYGEKLMQLCRRLFPTILDNEGELSKIIFAHFAPTKHLFDDLIGYENDFQEYVYDIYKENHFVKYAESDKTPYELMDEAGYILYPECQTEEDIQKFKKYYAPFEELCTFYGNRLNTCRVWFAVKKNVDSIRRADFTHPLRQDEYGTSVISIQFTKVGNHLSIKNRYNHAIKVTNCDCTFNNNLDNIIEGLTCSFKRHFNIKDVVREKSNTLKLDNYTSSHNRLYRINYIFDKEYEFEKYNLFFCENNVLIKNGEVVKYNTDRYILIDNYLFDLKNKKIETIDYYIKKPITDSFIKSIGKIKNITVSNIGDEKIVNIQTANCGDVVVKANQSNQLIGYINPSVTIIGCNFLKNNEHLKEVVLPNLTFAGNHFLENCYALEELNLPKLVKFKDFSLRGCAKLKILRAPKLVSIGYCVLQHNRLLSTLYIPNVKSIDDMFLVCNEKLTKLDLPNVKSVGNCFMRENSVLDSINAPKLKRVQKFFLSKNANIVCGSPKINMPKKTIFAQNIDSSAYNEKYNNIVMQDDEPIIREE